MDEFDCKPDFYVVGHSLGGLIVRWALGYLHSKSFFTQIHPKTYLSLCCPHLGILSPKRTLSRSWINLASYLGATEK
jgi:Ni/Fe-hydrogenase subunit HybB-like protein